MTEARRLSERRLKQVFRRGIRRELPAGTAASDRPGVLFLLAKEGADNSDVRREAKFYAALHDTYEINQEKYGRKHPDYERLAAEDPRTADAKVRPEAGALVARAAAEVRSRGEHVVIGPLHDHDLTERLVKEFSAAGYQVDLAVPAMHEAHRMAALAQQGRGYDATSPEPIDVAERLSDQGATAKVCVFDRRGALLNMRTGRTDHGPGGASMRQSHDEEVGRRWTARDVRQFEQTRAGIAAGSAPDTAQVLQRLDAVAAPKLAEFETFKATGEPDRSPAASGPPSGPAADIRKFLDPDQGPVTPDMARLAMGVLKAGDADRQSRADPRHSSPGRPPETPQR